MSNSDTLPEVLLFRSGLARCFPFCCIVVVSELFVEDALSIFLKGGNVQTGRSNHNSVCCLHFVQG
jgi:hypothetical protein